MIPELQIPLIAILRGITPKEIKEVAATLIEQEIKVIEVTFNSPDPLESIEILAKEFSKDALVGAGTVLTRQNVKDIANCGGELIVSPNCNVEVIEETKNNNMLSVPGCLTPTEMFRALEAGADMLKLFPGDIVTPKVIKSYRAILPPETKLAVTGGISLDNIKSYEKVDAFGVGAVMYSPGKSVDEVKKVAIDFVNAVK